MTKHEKTVLDHVLEEIKDHRTEVQEHGKVLARLDERTVAIAKQVDGVELRVESRINRRSAMVAAIVSVAIGVVLTFAFTAMGWPSG